MSRKPHPTQIRIRLNPIEKAVLAECEQWRTLIELQACLRPVARPEAITSAIAYLRRRQLIELRWHIEPLYRRTELGAGILRSQRRNEDRATRRPRAQGGLSLVR